jgi:hypothetical protein
MRRPEVGGYWGAARGSASVAPHKEGLDAD